MECRCLLYSASELYRAESSESERHKYRTECWLERCIFDERLCAPDEHITFAPLTIAAPIAGAESIVLTYSGLDQAEACWVRRLLRVLGITLAPGFSRKSTHLLCPAGTGAKVDKAREWGVPVVGMEWLEGIARSGVVPPVQGTMVEDPQTNVQHISLKGKEKEIDPMMVDIANGKLNLFIVYCDAHML